MTRKLIPLASLAVGLLMVGASPVQAARLQLLESQINGSHLVRVDTGAGDVLQQASTMEDLSGGGAALGFGASSLDQALPFSGMQVQADWSRMVQLDATGARTTFQATGSSSLSFGGSADVDALESADIGIQASLLVAPDLEADGTPVQVRLTLKAESLFDASVVHAEDTPTFHLQVLDAQFNPLVSYIGLPLRGVELMDLSFDSAVGQTLSFSLRYANGLSVVGARLSGTNTIGASALLDGAISVTAVPEPQAAALLLAGLGCLAFLRQRSSARR